MMSTENVNTTNNTNHSFDQDSMQQPRMLQNMESTLSPIGAQEEVRQEVLPQEGKNDQRRKVGQTRKKRGRGEETKGKRTTPNYMSHM